MRIAAVLGLLALIVALGQLVSVRAADGKYTLKTTENPPPKELHADIQKLLENKSVQIHDANGLYCEIWFRKGIPSNAKEEQVRNGLTYREFPETTLLGAIKFAQLGHDYREQKVKAGVYTLRLAFQPQDGDHMGTAPHPEFVLLASAAKDTKPATMDAKTLHMLSAESLGGNHPGALLLFPGDLKVGNTPKLVDQGMAHWVVKQVLQAEANGKPAPIGIGLTVVGKSAG